MSEVGVLERVTQNRVVKLFQRQLQYRYLGNWQDRPNDSNIEEDILREYLTKQGYSPTLIDKALYELKKPATDQTKSLYDINQEVYSLLRYGVKVKENVGENNQTVWLIDWSDPENNDFAIAEEVAIKGDNDKRPDIVIYVNGIVLGVLELKRSKVSISEGIRQNLDNQKPEFIKPFFTTMQLVMAGNDTQGLRYGTIETPEKYYLTWKEDPDWGQPIDRTQILDKALLELLPKARFLELIHDFIVFDKGIKKVCRPHQYFGIKATQEYLNRKEGGIIWHTQGSGKSLTMVWLAKWIKENANDSRVLIITDRDELDQQIEGIFLGVNESIYRTTSGRNLITQLDNTTPWLICSLIHKFGKKKQNAEDSDYEKYLAELQNSLSANFQAKGNIYVFVDECHRTQSGRLHQSMKRILPNAILIGFTGTPLLKQDKETTIEVFGDYVHTYKFNEAVEDKVVLDLRYEARNIEQNLTSPEKVDRWFEAKTSGLTELAKNQLKQRWGTIRQVLSSQDRLNKIVADIIFDMGVKDRLKSGRGNAMLVSGSIYQACKYYELFQNSGFTKCAIVTSYNPSTRDIKGETTGEEGLTEKLKQYDIYNKMLGGKSAEQFEKDVKKAFIETPAQMKLLIVVDKLLTGFDAPSATYLYIDKTMRDHGLFQAICRVNRLDGEDKEYGYIIDYKDLFKSLEKSVSDYTTEALDGYDPEDLEGLLSDRLEKAKERLEETLETVKALCEPVAPPQDTPAYLKYFCGNTDNPEELQNNQQKRIFLYKSVASVIRAYANIANEAIEAGYTPNEIARIKQEVKHYENVRQEVKIASGDYIDLKAYEPAMRHLIDTYIRAEESEKISAFDDLTLVQLIVQKGTDGLNQLPDNIRQNKSAVAETVENNLRTVITEEQPTNPQYFGKMSILLDELIQQRKTEAVEYEEYLQKIAQLCQQVTHPEGSSDYPPSLDTNAKRALYDNLNQDEAKAIALDRTIRSTKKDNWRESKIKQREVKNAIKQYLCDADELNTIFEIVKEQKEY
ncbi:MAG TPA: HsdR family type I site-specific deoxyribonuclease [Coleofasciculaceae cyanobacterium]|jgi:type I restriction enzyme R subunit